jgi:hypothetical protein
MAECRVDRYPVGMGGRCRLAVLIGLTQVLSSARVRAQAGDERVIAEALFRSGRDLMAEGRYAEACPKFAESERIDPKPGTLINLALCHEKTGHTASAWAEYLDAAGRARRAGQIEREAVARRHASELEPTLAHVVLDADPSYGAQVVLDGRPLGPGAFGTPIPMDPGGHVLTASAPGKKTFSESFTVSRELGTHTLRLPVLEPSDALVAPDDVLAHPPRETHFQHLEPPPPPLGIDSRRTWGLVAGGAGLALVGVGAFFGLRAFSERRTADSECDTTSCTPLGLHAIDSMRMAEAISTIASAAGLAALGGGAYLLLSAKSHTSHQAATWRLSPSSVGYGLRVLVDW